MASGDLAERAKAFGDAFLAERTAAILERVDLETQEQVAVDEEERRILREGKSFITISNKGLKATQERPAETGFLALIDSLDAYRVSFSAMISAEMLRAEDTEERICEILHRLEAALTSLINGTSHPSIGEAAHFFRAFSAIRSEEALDWASNLSQRMPSPESVLSRPT